MNREILFRAKRTDTGEWVEGGCYGDEKRKWIVRVSPRACGREILNYEVDPDTVGQYTGLMDKNGKKIFEGDIVRYADEYTGRIVFLEQTMAYRLVLPKTDLAIGHRSMGGDYSRALMLEIIGNIYDNPTLLTPSPKKV